MGLVPASSRDNPFLVGEGVYSREEIKNTPSEK